MDSFAPSTPTALAWSPRVPGWALPSGRDINETDAAFAAGIALKSLDDLIRAAPPWIGCWRDRLALKSAAVAVKMIGRSEEETAIRDAVLLTAAGDDPGPAGKLFLATRLLSRRSDTIGSAFVRELGGMLDLRWDEGLAAVSDLVDSAIQSGRAAPFAVADLITAIFAVRPDAEVLALGLAEVILAQKLKWPNPYRCCSPNASDPPSSPSVAAVASGRASRLIQKRSAWRWSMASTPRCVLRWRSTAAPCGCWPLRRSCAPGGRIR